MALVLGFAPTKGAWHYLLERISTILPEVSRSCFLQRIEKQSIQFPTSPLIFVSDNMRIHYSYSSLVHRGDDQFLPNRRNDQSKAVDIGAPHF
jgi:hypothetical protein